MVDQQYKLRLSQALEAVSDEVVRAKIMYPNNFVNQHEAYAVILEEVDELWTEIKKKQQLMLVVTLHQQLQVSLS